MRLRRAVARSSLYLMTIAIAAAVVGLLVGVERVISLTRAWQAVDRVSLSTEPFLTDTDGAPIPPQVSAPPGAARAGHDDQGPSSPTVTTAGSQWRRRPSHSPPTGPR